MSNVSWYCEKCGYICSHEFRRCPCGSTMISRDVENGPDGVERPDVNDEEISDDETLNKILTLMEKHQAGVFRAAIN